LGSIALFLSTDAHCLTLVSNKYKSPIDLDITKIDRLTVNLNITKGAG
jgi:hypothetical protein